MPGTTTPEPSPLVHVALHAHPVARRSPRCASSRPAAWRGSARGSPPRSSPSTNSGVRSDCAAAIASTTSAQRRRRGPAIEQRERVGEQRAAGRRRRVGEDSPVAVAHPHRLALDRAVAGEILARSASRRARAASRTRRPPCRRGRTARRRRRRGARARRRARALRSSSPSRSTRPSGAHSAAHSGVEVSRSARISAT